MSPAVSGFVESRILVNYRVELENLDTFLPEPFRGREVGETGLGIGSICFTRFENARPRFAPEAVGVSFETATHRVSAAVEGEDGTTFCVYVPQRDVSSRFCAIVGSLLLPTEFKHGDINRNEQGRARVIRADCGDKITGVDAYETDTNEVDGRSIFYSLESASKFLCDGGVEYSQSGGQYGGIEFRADEIDIETLGVAEARSNYFEKMGGEFDSAFIMRDVEGEWIPRRSY